MSSDIDNKPSKRRLRFRKNTIFRIYLFAFSLFFAFSSSFLVYSQSRLYKREISDLRSRVSSAERALAEVSKINSVSPPAGKSSSLSSPIERALKQESERLFWVEGHGFNKKWAYLDLEFKDGYRARYYFKPFPSRGELISLHRRIEHDAIAHYWDPALDLDEDEI